MPQKIYFGSVEVINTRTNKKQTIEKQLFKELDSVNDTNMRNKVLSHVKPNEREHFKILRFCFDTAKYLGDTVY